MTAASAAVRAPKGEHATLELFGSRAKGTARPDSDVDLLVTFEEGQTPGLGFFGLALDLKALLGHPVDLNTAEGIQTSTAKSPTRWFPNV